MKRNRFYIFPNLSILFVQGVIILFLSTSIFSLSAFRQTWLFSFDGIGDSVKEQVEEIDEQTFSYQRIECYHIYEETFEAIDSLSKEMTISEAEKVVKHPNSVVKIAAYKKLIFDKSEREISKNSNKNYEIFCQILNETEILQVKLGDCGYLITPTGWFFMDTYLTFYEDNINDKEYSSRMKKEFNLTDSEFNHLVELYQILEQKRNDFHNF